MALRQCSLFALFVRRMASESRDSDISSSVKSVLSRIENASRNKRQGLPEIPPRLVAVSKTKPVEMIVAACDSGLHHFGENYVTELVEKSSSDKLKLYKDIKWHFIGHLQRNKVSKVTSIPNLYMVETVDTQKLAESLNRSWSALEKPERLKVMVQVNTSGEENKFGCSPADVCSMVKFIKESCPSLELSGLMTIGSMDHDHSKGPNPDFECLVKCRDDVCKEFGLKQQDLELSMGMSADFEQAIEIGSTNVRVGSTIFGKRVYPKKDELQKNDIGASVSNMDSPLDNEQINEQIVDTSNEIQKVAVCD